MPIEDTLIGVGAGAVLSAGFTYWLTSSSGRRTREEGAVHRLEAVLTGMQVHVWNAEAPWNPADVQSLIEDGQRAVVHARTGLQPRHPQLVLRAKRAMALFDIGIRAAPGSNDNYRYCLDAYLADAFDGTSHLYRRRPVIPVQVRSYFGMGLLPNQPAPASEARDRALADPTLGFP